jgi:hypothetical protein
MKPFRTENHLLKVTCAGKEIAYINGAYEIYTPYDENPEVSFEIKDEGGYVEVDGNVVSEKEAKKLITVNAETSFEVAVYAQNFEQTESAKIVVKRDYTNLDLSDCLVKSFRLDGTLDEAVPVTQADKPEILPQAECIYEDGIHGKALTMSGSYGLQLLSDPSVLGRSYTIAFWMKPEQTGACYDPTIAGGNFEKAYWLNLTLDGKMWSSNGAWVSSGATGAYTAGEWQQVTLVVDGDRQGTAENTVYGELYVDGKKVNSGNIAADLMMQTDGGLYFGINPWDAVFTGAVSGIYLFNRNLSEIEVQGLTARENC